MVTPRKGEADSPLFARREQIVEAARAAIEEHGPDALTGQIAARAGLARPNVYRHFASKDDLDLAVARSAYHELRAGIRATDLRGSPLEMIRSAIAAQVVWADRHPNLYRFLLSRRYHGSSQKRQAELSEFSAELAAAAEGFAPQFADNPDTAAAIIVALGGLIDAAIVGWLNRPVEKRKQLIDRLAAHTWLIVDHELRHAGARADPPTSPGKGRRKQR